MSALELALCNGHTLQHSCGCALSEVDGIGSGVLRDRLARSRVVLRWVELGWNLLPRRNLSALSMGAMGHWRRLGRSIYSLQKGPDGQKPPPGFHGRLAGELTIG